MLTPERSVKRLFFNESSKLYFDLHDKTEEENFDKNNENLKYLNNVGKLLQIFVHEDITSNLETNVKFFMSETLCQNFCRNVMREEINYFPQQTYISLDC